MAMVALISCCKSVTPKFQTANERRAMFNRLAPVYDHLNDLTSLGQHHIWKQMNVCWSGAKKGERVLDICCGTGDLTFLLSEKVGRNGQVIGIDFSREKLSIASSREKQKSSPYYNIQWVEGDALDLPFPGCKASILDFNKTQQQHIVLLRDWMMDTIVIPITSLYGAADQFTYLKNSIHVYLTGEELKELAQLAGFSDAKFYEIVGGILVGNLVVTR